jgi:hypothetical protein
MAFQRLFLSSLLLAGSSLLITRALSGQGKDQSPDLNSLSDADLKTLTIQLERIACYGSCPVYTITIHGDGRVEYNGKSHVKQTGMQAGRTEVSKIRALASEFAKMKFWQIGADYSYEKCEGRRCTDMATAVIEVSVKGITHRVTHYYGCGSVPKALFDLESSIDTLANSKQWTGDVSKAGPYGTTCWGGN